LEEIQRAGVNETPSAEDRQTVLDRMDTVFADLLARNVILQPVGDEVYDEFFDHLACVLARRVAPRFGLGNDAAIKTSSDEAEDRLRTISRINRGTRQTLRVDAGLRPRRYGFTRVGF
jgi:hypothetical protein